jgi:phage N-6-adenine-methyltransferase
MTFWLTENVTGGATNVWLTPRWLLDLLGPFDLDPAGHPGWQTAQRHYYEADNGLYQDWDGFLWCNPPYGVQTADWVERWAKHPAGGLLLVANRSDTKWWQEAARGSDAAWFPKGRIAFVNTEGKEVKGTAFASIVFARGEEGVRRLRRAEHLGTILWRQ